MEVREDAPCELTIIIITLTIIIVVHLLIIIIITWKNWRMAMASSEHTSSNAAEPYNIN